MPAIKAYAHLVLRFVIGVALLMPGAWGLWRLFLPFVRIGRFPLGWIATADFLPAFALNALPVAAGIAVLRWRARGFAALYCLLVAPFEFARPSYFFPDDALMAFYAIAFLFLLLPTPRMPVRNPPAEPDEKNWRKWLLASLQGEGVRPVRDRFTKGFLAKAVQVLGVGAIVVIALAVGMPLLNTGVPSFFAIIVAAGVIFGSFGLARLMKRTLVNVGGDRYQRLTLRFAQAQIQARSAEEELQRHGSRRPILYLRAFAIDDRMHEEQDLVQALRKVGPVIAIGRPDEEFPPLGAARFYVDHAYWRAKVADIVRVAQLVVWVTGTTEGLKWELNHLRRSLPPEKLILWAHPHLLGLHGKIAEEEWTRFLAMLGSILPVPLPRELGDTRFFIFDRQWQPIGVIARGPHAQKATLLKLLDVKGIRKLPSRGSLALRLFGARLFYAVLVAIFFCAVVLRVFFGY